MVQVPYSRVTTLKDITPDVNSSKFVIYWCIAFKRTKYNFALQRAVEWANKLSQPLVILEPLILDYPMSSLRFHKFMMDGMKEVSETVSKTNFNNWKIGDFINLEKSLKIGDELGGHNVTGHIDGLAKLTKIIQIKSSYELWFEVKEEITKYLAEKGSVALNGISLTINKVENNFFR